MSIKKIREYTINVDGEAGEAYRRDCEMLVMQYQSLVNAISAAMYRSHFDAAMDLARDGNAKASQDILNEMEPDKMRIMVHKYADEIYKEQIMELILAIQESDAIN